MIFFSNFKIKVSRSWWLKPAIPDQKDKNHEFKASQAACGNPISKAPNKRI